MDRAKLVDPKNRKILEREADRLLRAGQKEDAIRTYRDLVDRNPEDYELRYWLMVVLAQASIEDTEDQSSIRWRLKEQRFSPFVKSPYSKSSAP